VTANPKPTARISFAEPCTNDVNKQPSEAQRHKTQKNHLAYQKRARLQKEAQLAHTKNKLAVASDQIFDLEQANLSLSKMSDQYQSVAQKSELLLKSRTERFVAFCERKEEEIQRIKSRATAKIMSLEKQHGVDLSQMEAELYRKDWTHTKEVVKYKTTIEHLNKSHE
jgi:di/tripeptidase